ncbi:Septum formation initiator [Pseudomonas syringae pv. tomato T1]|nr:Septum formation initiator [Pseudomonas syringae pv. tomato T1]KPX27693.1 Cell division protein FtsB [Pseudomonas syringae pv. delphinii]KPX75638.1 Cell division protein FtsB [Pseudomonas syringae pv. maculicola]KPY94730.1 Cell division protein FtsB [Pseudomonas syringae pv. tomato]RMM15109.1 Cell division protein FtsB [Pseudomonas syringae]RMM30338.1 Cell division protein FtsB [Pseudomonas syringae pv. berberidis]RMR03041.1 Cell division protein FtsB [Pseudomonas syringae pv. primulae]RM
MSGSMPSVICSSRWLCCLFYWVPDISMRSPNWLFLILLLLLAGLQYRLWVGNGSLAQVASLTQQIADQHAENQVLLERNRVLDAEVMELKKGLETVEERARHELGMVKEGETLYQLAQ